MTFSQFTAHFAANQANMPRSVALQIGREAKARLVERFQAGRADSALCFADLVRKIEAAVAGA